MNYSKLRFARQDICRLVLVAIALHASQSSAIGATPFQLRDVVEWGASDFAVAQLPLQRIIMESNASLLVTTSVNNKGYVARWAIRNKQLYLIEFKAEGQAGALRIGDIIDHARLPVMAKWFTGTLQLPVGEFDTDRRCYPVIVALTIRKGHLMGIEVLRNATETNAWDGAAKQGVATPKPRVSIDASVDVPRIGK